MAVPSDSPPTAGREPAAKADSLDRAIAAVPYPTLSQSLQLVAEELPPALSVDLANIRVLADDGKLYLVAAAGCLPTEIRKRAFTPLDVGTARDSLASDAYRRVAAALGLRAAHVAWIEDDGRTLGAIAVGSRTTREPAARDLARLRAAAARLARRLSAADRGVGAVAGHALELARRNEPVALSPSGRVSDLRPRERAILDLYADGLATDQIAEMLAISPHTVRTHVKLALRRLGARSRDEAAVLVRAEEIGQLL